MLRNLGIISTVLFTSQLLAVVQQCASSNSTWVCKDNKAAAFRVSAHRRSCYCLSLPSFKSRILEDGYKYTPGIGAHKFHKVGKTWNDARKACIQEGAHLAILNSEAELQLLNKQFKKEYGSVVGATRTDLAYLGVHAHFGPFQFTTVLGDPLDSIGFAGWNKVRCSKWGPQPYNQVDNDGNPQNCMALIRDCDSTDDHWCHAKLPFFCEKPDMCP